MYPTLLLSFLLLWLPLHPYHVSLTTIEYKPDQQEVQMTVKLFTDDLEDAMTLTTVKEQKVIWSEPDAGTDSLVSAYISRHLQINHEGQPVRFRFIGKEVEQEVVWCYLLATQQKYFTNVSVKNSLMTALFDDQINIVKISQNGKTKSLMLKRAIEQGTLSFESD